jgi:hypothetical protein
MDRYRFAFTLKSTLVIAELTSLHQFPSNIKRIQIKNVYVTVLSTLTKMVLRNWAINSIGSFPIQSHNWFVYNQEQRP